MDRLSSLRSSTLTLRLRSRSLPSSTPVSSAGSLLMARRGPLPQVQQHVREDGAAQQGNRKI